MCPDKVLAENNTAPIRIHLNFDTLYEDKVQVRNMDSRCLATLHARVLRLWNGLLKLREGPQRSDIANTGLLQRTCYWPMQHFFELLSTYIDMR